VNWQGAASCETGTTVSLILMLPTRLVAVALAETTTSTLPLPWPFAGLTSAIHVASIVAVHVHSGGAETGTVADPPAAATIGSDVGAETWHFAADGPVVVSVLVLQAESMPLAAKVSAQSARVYGRIRCTRQRSSCRVAVNVRANALLQDWTEMKHAQPTLSSHELATSALSDGREL
jgi:hypothetical protein